MNFTGLILLCLVNHASALTDACTMLPFDNYDDLSCKVCVYRDGDSSPPPQIWVQIPGRMGIHPPPPKYGCKSQGGWGFIPPPQIWVRIPGRMGIHPPPQIWVQIPGRMGIHPPPKYGCKSQGGWGFTPPPPPKYGCKSQGGWGFTPPPPICQPVPPNKTILPSASFKRFLPVLPMKLWSGLPLVMLFLIFI